MFTMTKETGREQERMTLGERVKKRRDELGISLNALARKAGVSTSYLWEIENGKRINLTGAVLERLADALGCSVDYLLGRDHSPSVEDGILRFHDPEFDRMWQEADPEVREDIAEYLRFKLEQQRRRKEKGDN